jgi:hypothetical protein
VRDVLRPSGAAIRRKRSFDEILLLGDPEPDHRFEAEGAGRAAPDILSLGRLSRDIGRMLELPGRRQVVGPGLCAVGEIVVPSQRRNAHQRAFAIVRVE